MKITNVGAHRRQSRFSAAAAAAQLCVGWKLRDPSPHTVTPYLRHGQVRKTLGCPRVLRRAVGAQPRRERCRCAAARTRAASAPGLGPSVPHLRRDWAHPSHIGTGTGLIRHGGGLE